MGCGNGFLGFGVEGHVCGIGKFGKVLGYMDEEVRKKMCVLKNCWKKAWGWCGTH